MSETQPPAELPKVPSQPASPEPNAPDLWASRAANVQKNLAEDLFNSNHRLKNAAEDYLTGGTNGIAPPQVEWKFNHLKEEADPVYGTPKENTDSVQRIIDQVTAPLALIKSITDVNYYQETNEFDDQIKPLFDRLLQSPTIDQASDLAEQIKAIVQAEVDRLANRAYLMSTSSLSIKTTSSEELDKFDTVTAKVSNPDFSRYRKNLNDFRGDTQRADVDLGDTCRQTLNQLGYVADPVSQFLGEYLQFKFPETK
jgi:hypothetical protein